MTAIQELTCDKCSSKFYDYLSNNRRYCSRQCAYSTFHVDHGHICEECKIVFSNKKKNSKFCSLSCSGKNANRRIRNRRGNNKQSGSLHWNWKGGTNYSGMYKTIRVDGKYQYEHRHVVEQHLGRKLDTNEQVHHLNMNHRDNRIENLLVVTPQWHTKLHQILRRRHDSIA